MIYPLPAVKNNFPLYIYGTGIIAISYLRQLNQNKSKYIIKGFINSFPSAPQLYGYKVINTSNLTTKDKNNSTFLIASIAGQHVIFKNLVEQGVDKNNIIFPKPEVWPSTISLNNCLENITLFPEIKNEKTLERILRFLNSYTKNNTTNINLIITLDFHYKPVQKETNNITITFINSSELKSILHKNTTILLWSNSDYYRIENYANIYFFDLLSLPKARHLKKPITSEFIADRHNKLKDLIRLKESINVVFMVFDPSIWKLEPVFKLMQNDSLFNPSIFICPRLNIGTEETNKLLIKTYNFFKNKGYKTYLSYNQKDDDWYDLSIASPDIVFFTTPNGKTLLKYLPGAYKDYLGCYYAYYFMATSHTGDNNQLYANSMFLNSFRVYFPHDYAIDMYKKLALNHGENGLAVGFPAVESIYLKAKSNSNSVWKKQNNNKKKIIFAPHHSFEKTDKNIGNFDRFGVFIQNLTIKYKSEVQWSFKPHPGLKNRLYNNPSWGKEKTDKYYKFWAESGNTQLDESEYEDLFLESDAIIHDSSSFMAEYLFTNKPCLYLVNKNLKNVLNDFGKGIIDSYVLAKTENEIEGFVDGIVNETINPDKEKRAYFESYVDKYYKEKLPSERIIDDLKQSLGFVSDQ